MFTIVGTHVYYFTTRFGNNTFIFSVCVQINTSDLKEGIFTCKIVGTNTSLRWLASATVH